MTRYKPPSIKDETLKVYLNRTALQHNGLNYATYSTMRNLGVSRAERARRFGVNIVTMWRYDKIQDEKLTGKLD